MRMLEGLQSQDAAVRGFIGSWVKLCLQQSDLDLLLHPLLRILQEADLKRASFEAPTIRPKVEHHSKYFYESLGKAGGNEEMGKSMEPALMYTQVYDTSQVLFALSILQSTVTAHRPDTVVARLGEAVVDLRSYRAGSPSRGDALLVSRRQESSSLATRCLGTREQASQRKSLLEFVLSTCVVFLHSEYPLTGEVSQSDLVANVKVKMAAAELITTILHEFVRALEKEGPRTERVGNPSYVSALVTLCDVQKIGLQQMACAVQTLKENSTPSSALPPNGKGTESLSGFVGGKMDSRLSLPTSILEPYFVQLLKLVQQLVVLDTLTLPDSSLPPPSPSASSSAAAASPGSDPAHNYVPSYPTAAQPLFQSLLLDALSDLSLLPLHRHVLDMATSLLSHVPLHLEDLVPRLIIQVCSNLGLLLRTTSVVGRSSVDGEEEGREDRKRVRVVPRLSGEVVVTYVRSLISLVHFCLLGARFDDGSTCFHQELDVFRDMVSVRDATVVPAALTPVMLQPSTVAWLFGMFSGGQKGSDGVREEQKSKMGGLQGQGQAVLGLLSRVYTVLADLWVHFRGSGDVPLARTQDDSAQSRKWRVEFEVWLRVIVVELCQ